MEQSFFRVSDSRSLFLCAPHLCSKKDYSSMHLASTCCIPRLCHLAECQFTESSQHSVR